jgi:hypothetical protein
VISRIFSFAGHADSRAQGFHRQPPLRRLSFECLGEALQG